MGQVIPIAVRQDDPEGMSPSQVASELIKDYYDKLKALPGMKPRKGQEGLSLEIYRAMVNGVPIAAEAPTGTGKTMAYLIAAVAVARTKAASKTGKDMPIVIATATVGLQQQIMTGDIPTLQRAGILGPDDKVAMAKGRGRYFCPSTCERILEQKTADNQFDFFSAANNEDVDLVRDLQELMTEYRDHQWNGDIDQFPNAVPRNYRQVAASHNTCVTNKCPYYNDGCGFFNARRTMQSANIIVANHDLVLADLAMHADDADPLFTGGRYLLVVDEAHHLPAKAIDQGAANLKVMQIAEELTKLSGFNKMWTRNMDLVRAFDKANLTSDLFDHIPLANGLREIRDACAGLEVDTESCQYRFVGGAVDPVVLAAASRTLEHAVVLDEALRAATKAIKDLKVGDKGPQVAKAVNEMLFLCAFVSSAVASLYRGLKLFTAEERAVRWLFRDTPESTSLHVCPLDGASVLRRLVWDSERVDAALVSATLQDMSGFARYKELIGAPESLRTFAVEPVFAYNESFLYHRNMRHSPKRDSRDMWMDELSIVLPHSIDRNEGSLVLFPSRKLMDFMLPFLRRSFGDRVLAQGTRGIKDLVSMHKERIDEGEGSILCGLATMAEGLDLPGAYCTHVLICQIPFAVPTSPVEQEQADLLGPEYFVQRAVPDALVKLIQMVGRLIRRESDRGRITMFDRRLILTQWGRRMVAALPDFKNLKLPVFTPDA